MTLILGDTVRQKDIGLNGNGKMIWSACLDCGKERWVQSVNGKPRNKRCHPCENIRKNWKGDRRKNQLGYIMVRVNPLDFFHSMTNGHSHYILEHRLVMAKSLGRCLHIWEIVHHKNHIRDDNRIENLQLISDDRHKQITILENKIHSLEKRVLVLEIENKKLQKELKKWSTKY